MEHIGIKIEMDKDGKVIYLNENALYHIKKELIPQFGYPRGAIEENDLIIVVDSIGVGVGELCDILLSKAGVADIYKSQPFIAVTKFLCNDQYPLIKVNDLTIETIYDGREISIVIEKNFVYICFDGLVYNLKLDLEGKQLVIFRKNRIVYFIEENLSISKDYLAYKGRLDYQAIDGKLHFKDIFDEKISGILELVLNTSLDRGLVKLDSLSMGYIVNETAEIKHICLYTREHMSQGMLTLGGLLERFEREIGFEVNGIDSFRGITGQSHPIQAVKRLLSKASPTNASILLLGESGCGKTLFAKEIHQKSQRSQGPLVVINCAAIPESLIESELFGYEEGAFTGAKRSGRKGFFEQGDKGTIFLDEIGELPLSSQGKLLEVLQNQSFYRVGGNDKINVNVRIIAATNQNLEQLVQEKRFRKDLFYRLNVFPVIIPPLRDRVEDIENLAKKFIPEICKRLDIEPLLLSNEALDILREHSWPGNVRELENVIEKACILCEGKIIRIEHLSIIPDSKDLVSGLKATIEQQEKRIIIETIKASDYNMKRTAKVLKIGRTTLFEKMKKYDIGG